MCARSALICALCVLAVQAQDFDRERLNWHTYTKPNALNVNLTCHDHRFYPFQFLNTTDSIGPGIFQPVKSVSWVLPNGTFLAEGAKGPNIQLHRKGIILELLKVTEGTHGLYHCLVEAYRNASDASAGTTTFYIKRGVNLYGANIYNNLWEKYSRNTLIGSVSTAIFFGIIIASVLLNKYACKDGKVQPGSSDPLVVEVPIKHPVSNDRDYGSLASTKTGNSCDGPDGGAAAVAESSGGGGSANPEGVVAFSSGPEPSVEVTFGGGTSADHQAPSNDFGGGSGGGNTDFGGGGSSNDNDTAF